MRDVERASRRFASLSAVSRSQEMPIAGVCHPAGAFEMAVMDASAAFRLASGIEAEQHLYSFLPMGAVSGRVQQAHVEFDVRLVVVGEILPRRRDVLE